eukprot:TRINITY_DN831_c0_g1_i4.p2 TRINITY_DN831_c0_g1~~TRINITY_DN831_c0_g1_i4.p2  ORF type:complete len:235 (+),score=63.08 TRINITY_DN831_c0_g1_i4:113-817(+)
MDGTFQEFWSVRVATGGTQITVEENDGFIHFSNIVLGEGGKAAEPVIVWMETEDHKTVLCTLENGRTDQVSVDIVLDGDAKVWHTSKQAAVYINGYKTIFIEDLAQMMEDGGLEEEDVEEDEPVNAANGKLALNELPKQGAKKALAKAAAQMEADSDEDDDEEEGEDDFDSDESEDEEEEEIPTPSPKADPMKKRPLDKSSKQLLQNKKIRTEAAPAGKAKFQKKFGKAGGQRR